jgi:hypothetical protein
MKPRHAAALALIGWYLLLPPKEGLIVKPAAPMRDWKIEQSFKTIRECEDFRHNVATATLVLENIRIARALAGEIEIDPNTEMAHRRRSGRRGVTGMRGQRRSAPHEKIARRQIWHANAL